jgi:anti-sigma regulatory factor (Ser/Thr protein kinase)
MVLHRWHLAQLAEDASLVISELASNAVNASMDVYASAQIVLRLRSNFTNIVLEVRDSVRAWPWPRAIEPDAEGGRGLAVIEALSDVWGFHPEGDGKVVWALL